LSFNEIMYHPATNEPAMEWVELRNQLAVDIDISDWSIRGGIQFTFASNTIVRGGGYIVVAVSPASLQAVTGLANIVGPFTGRLNNAGDTLQIRNNSGRVVDEISYGVDGDWPVAPDGSGVSLAKRDAETASGPGANWTVSEQIGGTPGGGNFKQDTFIAPPGLVSFWRFSEASGTSTLDLAGQNHGTVGAGATRNSSAGIAGALIFNGNTNAFVNTGVGVANSFGVSNAITIEAALAPGWSTTNSAVIFRKVIRRPAAYRDTVLANGPLAYWRLNDATTNVIADSTANAHNGAASAAVQLNQASLIPSDPGNAAVRTVGGERITIPGFEKIGANGYTVEFWVKPDSLPAGCCQCLVGDGEAAGDYFLMNYILGPQQGLTGAIRPHFGPANTPVSLDSATALVVNNTYHIVTTWDASSANNNAVIYINGVPNRVGTITRVVPTAGTTGNNRVYIGHDDREVGDGNYTYDEVALYNYPLTAAAVAGHYAAATITNYDVSLGNGMQLAFQNDGNNAAAQPPVAAGPVLSFGLTLGGVYSELDMPLDGQAGRPSLPSLENGQLHHIAATYDSATGLKAIYVDGVLRFSTTLSGPINAQNAANAVLGNSEVNGDGPFVGTLDEVAFWNKALSASEVAAHATAVAAGRDYFFTPAAPAPPSLAFNELSAATNSDFWLELVNYGSTPLSLAGAVIVRDGTASNAYVFPAGASVAAGGFVTVTAATLGFAPVPGDKLYLEPPAMNRVWDAVVVKQKARARSPAGVGAWLFPNAPSPGAPNSFAFHNEIVINEIMYHHIRIPGTNGVAPKESPEAWIELFNKGASSVDLTGWELAGGVSYRFTPGLMLAPGAYLVVAEDAVAMRLTHPGITIVGNIGGALSHSSDTIVLKDPAGNPADQVRYYDGPPWPPYANGGGTSLELRDPNADNARPEAWADSDESHKTAWQTFTYRALANIPNGKDGPTQPTQWNDFIFGLLGVGECLVDDISVIETPATTPIQIVANGGFENGLTGWRTLGNHVQSRVEVDPDNAANHVLHVISTGPQEHMHNHIECYSISNRTIVTGREYQISYRARWLAGNNFFNTRLYFNRAARTTALPIASDNGTPGAPNSRLVPNLGPTFTGLKHNPVVPQPGQSVTVQVAAQDPQGVAAAEVWWSSDGGPWSHAAMTDDGSGQYSGTIPGLGAGALVQFYVRAVDTLGAAATYPAAGTNSGAIYAVNDGQANLSLGHNFRIVLTPANRDLLHALTNVMSNDELPCTVIYDEQRAYYNVRVRLKGSQRGRYSDTRTSFHLEFPPDNLFRGVHPVMLIDRSGAGDSPDNKQQEILIRHILLRAGNIPGTQPDMARVIAPFSRHTGPSILSPRHEDEFIQTAYENGGNGTMWELELIYYPISTNQFGYKLPQPDSVLGVDIQNLGDDKEIYRYDFIIKNHRDADDYSRFITLGKTFSVPAGPQLEGQVRQVMDIDEWARTFALESLCGVGDSYTYGNDHNLFIYVRPSDDHFVAFSVDMDFSFNRGSTASLIGDQNLGTIFNSVPAHRRLFYSHVQDIIASSYNPSYIAYWVTHYQSFAPGQNYTGVPGYMSSRITAANGEINANGGNTAFNITTNNITTNFNLVTIGGTAPVSVRTIFINGIEYPITWTSVSAWVVRVPVNDPNTILTVQPYDRRGNPLTNLTRTVTVTYANPAADPAGRIVINEIMYNPVMPGAAYVELLNTSSNTVQDLSGWQFNGLNFTFPNGSYVTNRGVVVIAGSRPSYVGAYGNVPVPIGEFPGNLQNDGETLTLLRPGDVPGTEVVVDKVRYEGGPPWPARPNGGGASLQLIDARQDNSRVGNWTDGFGWKFFTFTGNVGSALLSRLSLFFENSGGDVYLDDISLVQSNVEGGGTNNLINSDFEAGVLAPWVTSALSSNSAITTAVSHSGAACLHLNILPGGPGTATFYQDFPSPLVPSTNYTLSFWYLPGAFGTNLNLRVNTIFRPFVNPRPVLLTPGQPNSSVATLPPFPPLYLNEVQPENTAGITDNFGERQPWVEIYNAGATPVPLDGFYLATNYASANLWAFPAGAALQPGEFKIVFVDGNPGRTTATDWHASVRVSPGSGSLALYWTPPAGLQVLDYLNYTNILAGRSYGDYPDGQVFERQEFFQATAGAPNNNAVPPIVVRINEWMAANSSTLLNTNHSNRYDDWVELYNPSASPANLEGYFLTDNLSNQFKFEIPPGYVIPPHGYLLVWADNHPGGNGPYDPDLHVNFALDQQGDEIGLFAGDGTLIDSVAFEPQFTDFSQGRVPNGTGPRYFMALATPRGPNSTWANRYPVLSPIADAHLVTGQTLSFVAQSTDPDTPPQTLQYSLDEGAPVGAAIDPVSGVFSWMAPATPATNRITVRVTDSGTPPLSAAQSFEVRVEAGFRVSQIQRQPNGDVVLQFDAIVGKTYRVEYTDSLGTLHWIAIVPDQLATSPTLTVTDSPGGQPQRFYRVRQLD
jgi:hypothetical protein